MKRKRKPESLTVYTNMTKHSVYMKAQAHVLEYLFLTFFVVVIIVALMFFLTSWSVFQFGLDKEKMQWDRALFLAKHFQNLPMLVYERSMFDDSKLTALISLGPESACNYLEPIMGRNWFAEITSFDGSNAQTNCTYSNYPNCNHWTFCEQQGRKTVAFVFPINVYRKFGLQAENNVFAKVELGTLKLGVYE